MTVLACAWCARPSRSPREALLIAGVAGFGAAVGVHGLVGYTDLVHVGPAILGAAVFAASRCGDPAETSTLARRAS